VAAERRRALGEQRNHFVFPHRIATGEVRWVEVYSTPIEAQGKALLFSIIHDITERKRAEELIQRHTEELRVSNEELTRFNSASVGRELQMIELKKEVNEFCGQIGQPPRYPLDFNEDLP